jgi:CheY-like chemotaxis protein
VKHTENVEEVIKIAHSGAADLILMDVSLSRSVYQGQSVDGIKITQILKSNPKTANLPVILVTAHAMEGDRENFLKQSGADGYISKPVVDHQQFVEQIIALIPTDIH